MIRSFLLLALIFLPACHTEHFGPCSPADSRDKVIVALDGKRIVERYRCTETNIWRVVK